MNELGVAEPSIAQQGSQRRPDPGAAARRHRRRTARRKSSARPALLELKIVEQGPSASSKEALLPYNGQVPAGHGGRARRERRTGRRGAHASTTWCARPPAVTGRDLRNARPSLDENNQPAVSFTLNTEGAREVRQGDRREHRPRSSRSSSTAACSRRRASTARITSDGPHLPAASRRRRSQNLSLILRSGALPATLTYLEERTIGPSLGADSIRSGVIASVVGLLLVVALHADLLQAVGRERGRRAHLQPGHPARPDGLHRRGDDAARHRRLRADDGHRRRLERADLRAHQGGARRRSAACARRSTPASAACS